MKTEITLHTRREFLRSTVLGSALSWTLPTFLANTFSALQAEAADKATQAATGRDSSILVVLQMAGGNDGLNTLAPYSNDYYHRARPKIGLGEKGVIDAALPKAGPPTLFVQFGTILEISVLALAFVCWLACRVQPFRPQPLR